MQASRLLIALLLLATVLVDLVMLSVVGMMGGWFLVWPHPMLAVLFSLAFGQVSVAAVWAGLSGTVLPWRLAGLVGVVTLWSVALASELAGHPMDQQDHEWTVLFLAQVLPTLSIFLIIRARGGRLLDRRATETEPQERRWQFSLLHLFVWLTATAVALGLLRCTIDYDSIVNERHVWPEVWYIALSNSAVCLATVWATLGPAIPVLRVAVLCMVVTGVLSPLLWFGGGSVIIFALLWLLQVLWIWAWLIVLHTAGIGFVWRNAGNEVRAAYR